MAIDTEARIEIEHYKNYVGGEWVDAGSGDTFDVINPADGRTIATVPNCDRDDAKRAIAAAREAFDSGVWSEMEAEERKRVLLSVVERFAELEDELATIETMQSGMTIRATSTVVIGYCLQHWDYFSRGATRPMQEPVEPVTYPTYSYNFVLREPIGVCAGIIPWNFPLVMAVWKIAPALAMGNTMVLKPASNTPLTALKLAEMLDQTELPKGVINVITGGGSTVGEELASNPDVDKVGFTGSTVVGRRIMQLASSTIKKCTLELGGKSPNIVYDDADMDQAIDGSLWATFFHQGQVCESGTRLLVPESIHDQFVDRLIERAKQIRVGDPMDFETDMGPLVSAAQLETVEKYVQIGKDEGATLALGGNRVTGDGLDDGYYFEPTIFTGVDNSMTIAQEEIFGPVLTVIPFSDDDDAIRIANDTIYGLASGVWSTDPDRIMETAKRLRAGTVWINDFHLINCVAPFGGYKQSGIGREMASYGLNEYTEVKHVHWDLGTPKESKLFGVLLSE
ncbi:MAG: aldehyde dehydrogenase family protein [Solirubrobacterales bacterium]